MTGAALTLAHISVRGVVQGVGFRPFVYQLARRHNLKGWVCNTSADVRIEVEGEPAAVERFILELGEQAPPRAHIEEMAVNYQSPVNHHGFIIRESVAEAGKYQLVSPDIATCLQCLEEILSPADRRYRYAFTNCTNCGPRFTIIEDIPYDRPATTMRHFQMCPDCRKEYDDPLNRRFHAQPNACPGCGPNLELQDAAGKRVDCADAVDAAAGLLKQGKIIAIKGMGGFLLAGDATNGSAVNLLRLRKQRPSKPFAVMLASLEDAQLHCYVNIEEARLLTSSDAPIVLLRRRKESAITQAVAPGLKYLGVMLPYTPLHHLLMREAGVPLVMTSGNRSEEPIARDNDEALRRLGGIADYFLVHNRDIYARYDDSVTMVERGVPQVLRRARGYAPYPLRLPHQGRQVLACGAEEKNSFCLTRDNYAFVSQHIGDLENMETLEHFVNTIELYKRLFRIEPEAIAYDMHPEYLATRYAKEQAATHNLRLVPVQHHHAHIVSCMADNGIDTPVIGVAFDGTGYGTDGNLWGGEFMVADYRSFTRAAHFQYLPLPGGALAIRKPYRAALGWLLALGLDTNLPALQRIDAAERDIIESQVAKKINSPLTSSCGRLFDVVSALLGVRGEIDYSAQAAIELEMLADEDEAGVYPFAIAEQGGANVVMVKDLLSAMINEIKSDVPAGRISACFHNTVARIIHDLCQAIAMETGIRQAALSGGVFQNRLLLRKTSGLLESGGFTVYTHRMVPCNDGGIALGQAVIAGFSE